MNLYRLSDTEIEPLPEASLADQGVRERQDLQRVLRESIETIAPDTMVIAEEFSGWEDSRRSIDLLGLDRQANLVVIELKRDDHGGHMELQALRYAAMVEPMTFERMVQAHADDLSARGDDPTEAEGRILEFLGWPEPDEAGFGGEVRIVLAAADFCPEIATTVLWLSGHGIDIRCVRLVPHKLGEELVLSVQQCLPPPATEQYQVRLRGKATSRREARRQQRPWTGCWHVNVGDSVSEYRSWEDARRYGFLLAGSGPRWIQAIRRLAVGDRVMAYVSAAGYVGVGRVTRAAAPQKDFVTDEGRALIDLPLHTPPRSAVLDDPERCDWCVGVQWLATVSREQAVLRHRAHRQTVARICEPELVTQLTEAFGVESATADPQNE